MKRNTGSVRPLSVVVTIIVVGRVLVSFLFLRHSVASQEQSLLQSDTSQLALVLDEAIAAIGTPLSTLGEVMAATQDSPSLFEAQAKTTRPTGTGLGLAVVKRFTEGHNGTVSIEGAPSGGARVTVRLPKTTARETP